MGWELAETLSPRRRSVLGAREASASAAKLWQEKEQQQAGEQAAHLSV